MIHPIKQFCIEKNLSLKSFSDIIEISAPYLTQIIKGDRKPSFVLSILIEQKSGGAIKAVDLRPELKFFQEKEQ